MKFRRNAKIKLGPQTFDLIPFVDVIFQLVLFYILITAFTFFPEIGVKFPKAVTSDSVNEEGFVVVITSENVIYWRNKIASIQDLRAHLRQLSKNNPPIIPTRIEKFPSEYQQSFRLGF